ncbi:MAG: HAD family phosphatase [Paludibacteraceae bacterium]|nr:HAD family phosphatase [Paludibacteraceae bacterium]
MIKNVIFDFGCVLVYWSQHNLYDTHFGSKEKTDWFVDNICTWEWNNQTDLGKSFAESVAEKVAEYPEWETEIRMYWERWEDMLNGEVPGMKEWICELKNAGYKVYGLSNWSHETFPMIKDKYEAFSMMDGIVMSGEELIAKPDLRIYKILLERYGLKAEECVFIDDRKENIIAGEQVGIRGIIFEDCEQVKQAFHVLNQKSNEY